MTISIANTLITNTFEYWRSRTNELAYAMSSNTVTTGGGPAVGNAYVTGLFFANNLSSNTLSVTSASTFANTLGITGAATFSNTLSVTGAATFSNTSAHTGAATFSNTVGVTGATTLSSTLALTGAAILSNTISVTGAATFSNTTTHTGAATFANTLGATGAVTFANTLTVTGSITANGGTFNGVFANSAAQDVIITGTSSVGIGATLAGSGVTAGGYGSTVNAVSIVVDAKGRITSISNAAINVNTALGYTPLSTAATHANAAAQDVTIGGTYNSLTAVLATTGVTAGGYGSAANAVSIVVDAKGRITSITNTAINVNTALGYTPLSTTSTFANSAAQDVQVGGTFGALTTTLATTGVTAGGYGSSVNAISVVVDAKGRITSISNAAINVNTALGYTPLSTAATHANAAAQDVSIGGTYNSLTAILATTGVSAATYGDSTSFPIITVDAKGRITSVTTQLVNSAVATQTVNNALFLVGVSGNNFVQNTDSRTLSGNLVFSSLLEANGVTNAAIVIKGSLGVGNNIYANLTTASAYFNNVFMIGAKVSSTVDSTATTTGALVVLGGLGVDKNLFANAIGATAYFNNVAAIGVGVSSTVDSTSTATGALRVSGGVGIAKNLYANATTATAYFNNVVTLGVDVTSTVDSTSILTGSINTDGGVGIAKNLYANGTGAGAYFNNANVMGNLGVTGTVYLGSTIANSSYYTGTAANANTLGGQVPTYYLNTSTAHANAAAQDVNISGAYNSLGAILATTGVTAGGYGSSVNAISIVVDAKGRVTSISNAAINVNTALGYTPLSTAATFANSAAQDVQIGGTFGALTATLATTGVTAGSYGNTTTVPTITIDAKGRITSVTNNTITSPVNTVNTTGNFTIAGNLVFSGVNTHFNSTLTIDTGATLSLNGLTLGNTAGSLDLNNNGITDYISTPAAKTVSFTVANSESGSIYQCSNATVATLVTLPASAVTGFNATVIQSGAANVIVYAASGTLLKRTGVGANTSTANIGGQYGMATLLKLSTGWVIGGDVF